MRRLANMKSRKPTRPRLVTFFIRCRVEKDGNWYLSSCLNLPVRTQDTTQMDALENLRVAIQLFVEGCLREGTLQRFIDEHGWNPSPTPLSNLPEGILAIPVPLPSEVRRYIRPPEK
jgi:predicted RNase H-like HicB family nuclease